MLYRELIVIAFILLCVFAGAQIAKFFQFVCNNTHKSKHQEPPTTVLPAVTTSSARKTPTKKRKVTTQRKTTKSKTTKSKKKG